MSRTIQSRLQSTTFCAAAIIAAFVAGCSTPNLDGPIFGKSKSSKPNYSWNDFLKDTDSNGNTIVETSEFNDYLTRQGGQSDDVPESFSEIDVNGNGSISEAEFNERASIQALLTSPDVHPWESFVVEADRNDDGDISGNEWAIAPREQPNVPKRNEFKKYDLNNDGQVSRDEYLKASKQ